MYLVKTSHFKQLSCINDVLLFRSSAEIGIEAPLCCIDLCCILSVCLTISFLMHLSITQLFICYPSWHVYIHPSIHPKANQNVLQQAACQNTAFPNLILITDWIEGGIRRGRERNEVGEDRKTPEQFESLVLNTSRRYDNTYLFVSRGWQKESDKV